MPLAKLFPTRTCPECHEPFTAVPRRNGTVPEACRGCIRAFNGKRRRGIQPLAFRTAIARKKQTARAKVEAQVREEFGSISAREAALFSYGVSVGYQRGYDVGYRLPRKRA